MTGFQVGAQVQWKERSLSNLTALCTYRSPCCGGALSGYRLALISSPLQEGQPAAHSPVLACQEKERSGGRKPSLGTGGGSSQGTSPHPSPHYFFSPFHPKSTTSCDLQVHPVGGAQEGDFRTRPICHDATLLDSHFNSFFCSFATPEARGPESP